MTSLHAKILSVLQDEVGLVFDANDENMRAIANGMKWKTAKTAYRHLEAMRRAGLLIPEGRKAWYEPKRWRVAA